MNTDFFNTNRHPVENIVLVIASVAVFILSVSLFCSLIRGVIGFDTDWMFVEGYWRQHSSIVDYKIATYGTIAGIGIVGIALVSFLVAVAHTLKLISDLKDTIKACIERADTTKIEIPGCRH